MGTSSYPPNRTALLFIDPYNDFLSDGGPPPLGAW